jgi:hypothetical protein
VQQLVIDDDYYLPVFVMQQDVVAGKIIFILIPGNYLLNLSTARAAFQVSCLGTPIRAKHLVFPVVAHVTGLNDEHVLTM